MAHKTFISYKYSEGRELRDRIIKKLGDDARYYQGEDGYSENISDLKSETIKKRLKDMIFNTSVTIVIISPNMKQSEWMEWEIAYSLKEIPRDDKTSRMNGVIGVISKSDGGYSWVYNYFRYFKSHIKKTYLNENLVPEIISQNINNGIIPKGPNRLSYIDLVNEDDFLSNHNKYIEEAFEKSKNGRLMYDIKIQN